MTDRSLKCVTTFVSGLFLSLSGLTAAQAVPAAGTAYYTDPQNSYVEDATSKGVGQVNMITCLVGQMNPAALVNKGAYTALVNERKCDSSGRASTDAASENSSGNIPSYSPTTLISTRTALDQPMLMKAWLHSGDESGENVFFIRANALQAPTTSNPYGVFRLDFCGKALSNGVLGNSCPTRGYLDAATTGLTYFQIENENGRNNQTSMALTQSSGGGSGSGRLRIARSENNQSSLEEYTFAYNATHFLRADTTSAQTVCFSRSLTDAKKSVWRYGLYKADGSRFDRLSGFPVSYSESGKTYQGYMGYYGLSLSENKQQTIANGATLAKQSFGENAASVNYTLVKSGGRLSKYVKKQTTLDKIANLRLNVSLNESGMWKQYEIYWDADAKLFQKSGTMTCGMNGCNMQPASGSIANSVWVTNGGIAGWSQSLGGEFFIGNVGGLATPASVLVNYREQNLVFPADMPSTLYCLGNCLDAASMTAYFANNSTSTPYIASSANAEFTPAGLPINQLVNYSASNGVLMTGGQAVVFNSAWSAGQSQYGNGVRTGKLFTDPTTVACANNASNACGVKVNELDAYYVWETGPNAFNQFFALRTQDNSVCTGSTDAYCRFDAPLQLTYSVPANTAVYGEFAGLNVVLQYGGFGNLWGVPGQCVNRITNAVISCNNGGGEDVRFVPAFEIPLDTTTGTVSDGTNTYYVKWLDREVRFTSVATSACNAAGLTSLPTTLALPDGSLYLDPGTTTSATYIGAEPVVTGAPRVVDGVTKY